MFRDSLAPARCTACDAAIIPLGHGDKIDVRVRLREAELRIHHGLSFDAAMAWAADLCNRAGLPLGEPRRTA